MGAVDGHHEFAELLQARVDRPHFNAELLVLL
jgi:hypothetical protein